MLHRPVETTSFSKTWGVFTGVQSRTLDGVRTPLSCESQYDWIVVIRMPSRYIVCVMQYSVLVLVLSFALSGVQSVFAQVLLPDNSAPTIDALPEKPVPQHNFLIRPFYDQKIAVLRKSTLARPHGTTLQPADILNVAGTREIPSSVHSCTIPVRLSLRLLAKYGCWHWSLIG